MNGVPAGRVDSAKVVPMVEVIVLVGSGTTDDPARTVTDYWHLDGTFVARINPTDPDA